MPSALASRTPRQLAFSDVELPEFLHSSQTQGRADLRKLEAGNTLLGAYLYPHHSGSPHLVAVPSTFRRRRSLMVRINHALRTVLVALCGMAILGYGLDVQALDEVSRLEEQARRINEQNSELSAQLLKAISFEGIQGSALGRFGLHVPEQVVVVKELPAPSLKPFQPHPYSLPVMSGY